MLSLRFLLRGLALLRYPELVRDLGERRFHLQRIEELRGRAAGCRVDSNVQLVGYNSDRIDLGPQVTIGAGSVLAFGDQLNGFGRIRLGGGTWIGQYNNLRAGGGDIDIGEGCLVSQFCTMVASNHGVARKANIAAQPPDSARRGVTVGNDVWLGAGVTLTPGIKVSDGAVIGAGAVVTHDVPPYEVWAGIPAKKISERP